ncbi:NAD-dependent succinate-semialdehyde dehydrogenase [Streptococcus pyogenes]|uniref:NAD-dependent succinate-semialdehyde dehydrogenase n=1 Tax=Streptococcus pyogenes TaxID=1314 RepID=UPI0010A19B4B|nr:NAD-dependent succinate-semialdehyde dehydrogenase [Streptococcus pyogenes]QCK37245.1 NAD-dependent succinate-semialdehyde dehydrogenase [Streptococcus pyogenes]VGQ22291.1 succinate-semialdehyde dehydrogenase [Streptococcus pyogenes]VGV40568.1 succinate-semialdehyde dehydrogenase [Streptococcus pyogenes]VGV43877.1 succinate-semialdehyde dehydrogenase [Streptococcus pyogenes]VHB95656.1 succinate-semialdehyde dehydrogenase [Streptococcus pyogenes]
MAYQTIYPYTNEVLHTFDNMTDQGLADVLERAHLLYKKWRKEDHLEERKVQLHQVANILRRDRDKYAEIITKDMGKLFTEAQGEVDLCADIADYYADKADEFLMSTPLETDSGQAYYLKQSTGVILAVEPWNFPYYQIMRVFAPNFIVGNPMVLKHASICPRSAQSFEELVLEAGAEAGSITNLFISYDQVSQVIADKRVVGVCLTGSERGGASIAEEAGKNLKKTTLELGGDDAFIILDDADWDQLEKVLYFSRLYNAGQVCTSSKRFIVLDKDYDRFKELLTKVFKTAKWGDPMDPETTLAPLSSAQAKADVLDQIKLALDNGAELVYGGEAIDHPGHFVMPTIIAGLTKDNPIYYQEIFGPVGEIYKVSSEEEAIEVANDSNYGLGGTIFSSNQEHAKAVAAKIETGMSFINSGWTSLPELPFGGIKHSGYGRELSELGFTSFVNEHLIYIPNKTNNSNTKV